MPTTLSPPLKVAEIRSRIEPDLKENATRVLAMHRCAGNAFSRLRSLRLIPACHKEVNSQYFTCFQVITPHEILLF